MNGIDRIEVNILSIPFILSKPRDRS